MSWFSHVLGSSICQPASRRVAVLASAVELLEDRRLLSASCAPYPDYNPCQPRGCIEFARSSKGGDNCQPQAFDRGSFGKGNDCRPDWNGPAFNGNGRDNCDSDRGKDKDKGKRKDRCDNDRRNDRCDNGPLFSRGGKDDCDNGYDNRKKDDYRRKDDDCRRDNDYRRKDNDCRRDKECRNDRPESDAFFGRGGKDDCDRGGDKRDRKDRCDYDKRDRKDRCDYDNRGRNDRWDRNDRCDYDKRDRKDRCDYDNRGRNDRWDRNDRKDDCDFVTFRSGKNSFCDRPRQSKPDCEPQQQSNRWSGNGDCFAKLSCKPTWCGTVVS